MDLPDPEELCICFHVSPRQMAKFLRFERPRVVSQCSECYGAGTGCGWCIPFIEQLFERYQAGETDELDVGMDWEEYRARRQAYLRRVRMDRMAPKPPEPGAAPEPGLLEDELEP